MTHKFADVGSINDLIADRPDLSDAEITSAYTERLIQAHQVARGVSGLSVLVVSDQSFEALQNRGV